MAYEIYIPKLGANMTEGKIESWYVKEGDLVEYGDPLFDLVTDKATVVVEAENKGVIKKILVPAGETVPIVTTVAIIAGEDEDISDFLAEIEKRKTNHQKEFERPQETSTSIVESRKLSLEIEIREERTSKGKVKASPAARKKALDAGIDIANISPSGVEGIVTVEDVENYIQTFSQSRKKLAIIGAGEYSRVILEILQLNNQFEIAGFIDDNQLLWGKELEETGLKVLGGSEILHSLRDRGIEYFIVSIGVPKVRSFLFQRCLDAGLQPANAIHPCACVSKNVKIEPGCVIEAFSVVAVNCVIQKGSFITQNCSVSHDCVIKEFCHLAPGCHLGGAVTIGKGSLVGIGAAIAPHLEVGDHVIIAPGASVDRPIPRGSVVEGVPGKIIGRTALSF